MKPLYALVVLAMFSATHAWSAESGCSPSRLLEGATGKIKLCYEPKRGDYVSESCLKGACHILKLVEKVHKAPIKITAAEQNGGRNPHSLACSKAGGKVRILKDADGDEQSYCQSEQDQSIVSTSLFMWTTDL